MTQTLELLIFWKKPITKKGKLYHYVFALAELFEGGSQKVSKCTLHHEN